MASEIPSTAFHPGAYLQELLIWQKVSPEQLADSTGIPKATIIDVTRRRRGIDKALSRRLAAHFGNSARFWLDLQKDFDYRN